MAKPAKSVSSPSDKKTQRETSEYQKAWDDATLNASMWLSLQAITPAEAAALLCGLNPLDIREAADIDAMDPATLALYRPMARVFEDLAKDGKPRTLRTWLDAAIERKLKHDPWILRHIQTPSPKQDIAKAVHPAQKRDAEAMRCDTRVPGFEQKTGTALEQLANGRDHITTEEFAHIIGLSPQTVRKNYSATGEVYRIRPKKPGSRLLWPVADIAAQLFNSKAN